MKLPNAITSRFSRQLLQMQKHSPKLMFATGVVGIVGAGVWACHSTLKLSEVLENAEKQSILANTEHETNDEYSDTDYTKDLAKIKVKTILNIAKLYAPAVGVAVVSIGLLTGSHVVLNRRNASLTAAYATLDQAYRQYRERVVSELGGDKDREFRYGTETVEESVEGKDGKIKTVKHTRAAGTPSQYAKFFDKLCDPWVANPEYNRIFLQAQQNYANEKLQAQGHLFLNEVYDMLDIPRTGAGAVVGWVFGKGGDDYVDFGIFDPDSNERVIDFVNGREGSILLDFNVDGVVWDKI